MSAAESSSRRDRQDADLEEAESSSRRDRQDTDLEKQPDDSNQEPPQRRWVALISKPVVLVATRNSTPTGTEVDHDFHDPPRPSFLVLRPRFSATIPAGYFKQETSTSILAVHSGGHFLLQVTDPGRNEPDLLLYNADARAISVLPGIDCSEHRVAEPHARTFGLIAHPELSGHLLVAQYQPRLSVLAPARLLCYSTPTSTRKGRWFVITLSAASPSPDRNPSAEAAVIAHAGSLWWAEVGRGVFVCDVFNLRRQSELRFLPLPDDCEIRENLSVGQRILLARRRRVAPSEGHLHLVDIEGDDGDTDTAMVPASARPRLRVWTLLATEAASPWTLAYELPFAEVWKQRSYADAGLPHEIPDVAFLDPNNHGVVYFLLGSTLFGLDVGEKELVFCNQFDALNQDRRDAQSCRPIIDAWQFSSTPHAGEMEGFHRNVVRLAAENPFADQRPARLDARPVPPRLGDQRTGIEIGLDRVGGRLRQRQKTSKVHKLAREGRVLRCLRVSAQDEEPQD